MTTNRFLPAALAFLAPPLVSHADTILWTTGTSADASGSWAGPATFNGQPYTSADALDINGTATTKTVTTTGEITTPLSLTVSSTGATTLTGTPVSGTLAKTNAGVLTLASANTFGDVTISGGKFVLTNAAALGTTGTLNVNSGTVSGVIGSYGAPGATFFYDAATLGSSYTLSKNLAFGTVGTNTTYGMAMQAGVTATPLTTTISGNVTGASNITLWLDVRASQTPNPSTWILSGDNSGYAGNFRLNRGNIRFESAASLGTGTIFVQTNGSDGTGTNIPNLSFGFSGTVSNPVVLRAGSGTVTSLDTGANNLTLSNTVTLSGDATAGASSTFNKIGSGTLALTGTVETVERVNGTATATAPLVQGGLDAGNVSANLRAGTLDVSGMTGSTLTFKSLAGVAETTLALGAKALELNGTTASTFSGTLSGTGGTVTKSGTGEQTFTGTNSYTGGTTISGKSLGVGSSGALGSGPVTVSTTAAFGTAYASGGTPFLRNTASGLNIPNDIVMPATAGYYALQSATTAGSTVGWSGNISGGGTGVVLQIDTQNSGDSTTTTALSGTSTFAGQIRLNRGRVILANSSALGTADLFLQTNPNASSGNVDFDGITSIANNLIVGTTASQWIDTEDANITLSGSVSSFTSGVGGFSKMGSGTLLLTGSVASYSPATTAVEDGTLDLSGITGTTFNTGTLTGDSMIALPDKTLVVTAGTFSGELAGANGSLSKTGTGVLSLTGTSTYSGATIINEGTLSLTGTLGASAVDVKSGATLAGNGLTGGGITVRTGGRQTFALADFPGSQLPRQNSGALVMESDTILNLTAAAAPAPGTYILATADGGITGAPATVNLPQDVQGVVSVVGNNLQLVIGGDPYAVWANSFNLSGAEAEFEFDADKDGIDNGLEWILGGNPTISDLSILPVVTADETTGLSLTFYRNPASVGVANLAVEWDVDLDAFANSVTIGTTGIPANGNNPTVALDVPATGQVTVTIPAANAPGGRLFARLTTTKN